MNMPAKWPIDRVMKDVSLSDHQKEVVIHNMKAGGRVLVLPGSPGTGKTFTLGRILSFFGDVAACAPTGKAAQRLTQCLNEIQATTIHRLLEPRPLSGGGFIFTLQNGEIDRDVVAVDETSMCSNELMTALFKAVSPEALIILVGDQNQLPPVGPGTMLRDIQSTNRFRELTDIVRNDGMIVRSCASVRDMKVPILNLTLSPGENIVPAFNVHLTMANKDEDKSKIVGRIVDKILSGDIKTKDKLQDVQFMVPTHKNPHVGREVLNLYLQSRLNPAMLGEHAKFKLGDKVICVENCFLKTIDESDGKQVFVANGELGIVTQSLEKRIAVKMMSTGEEVMAPCGKDGNGWNLGYVLTVHKTQGSEFPVTVTILGSDYGSSLVMCRELLYTALSRAKICSIIVASPAQIPQLVKKVKMYDRKSMMTDYWEKWSG